MTIEASAPRVVAIIGPTAAGKSAVARDVAGRLDAEIVAVDAFTIYRGMDIGTATPTPAERAAVPHHLVNELEPEQDCSAQWFQVRGRQAIAEVHGRGRTALLVGGSGLYFRSVVDPLEFPPTDAAVRRDVTARYPNAAAAYAALRVVDPEAAMRMDPGNHRRAVRALEVQKLTGRPFSDWRRCWERYDAVYPDLQVFGLEVGRDVLSERITARVDEMLAAGFVDEAAALRGRRLSRTAATAIGYAELWAFLDGEASLEEARERTIVRTRRYAARQQRWFARDPRVRWVSVDAADDIAGAVRARTHRRFGDRSSGTEN
jgi:tRNA dimethylallyltransferase